jgi:hypothetical protein
MDPEEWSRDVMNITLSADEALIKRAREVARRQGKSLNEMVRQYLLTISGGTGKRDPAAEFAMLVEKAGGHLDGQSWTREELHERR